MMAFNQGRKWNTRTQPQNAEVQKLVLLDQDSKLCFPLHQEALLHIRWI